MKPEVHAIPPASEMEVARGRVAPWRAGYRPELGEIRERSRPKLLELLFRRWLLALLVVLLMELLEVLLHFLLLFGIQVRHDLLVSFLADRHGLLTLRVWE